MGITFRVAGSQAGRTRPRAIGVLALAKAKAGAEDRLKTEILALVAPSRAETDNISYDFYQGIDDKTTFVFYENWASVEAFDRHKESPHFQGFLTATTGLLDGELKVTLLNEMSEPSEPDQWKKAWTRVPKTAEFKPYRDAEADPLKRALMAETAATLGRVVQTHADPGEKGLRPDDLYKTVLEEQGLRERWQKAFGGDENGRDLFGLVAWTYFYDHEADWLGTPPNTPGLGKRSWVYRAESTATAVAPIADAPAPARTVLESVTPAVAPCPPAPATKFEIGQCVLWTLMQQYGRIISEPQEREDTRVPQKKYKVRFPKDALGDPDEKSIGEKDLCMADDSLCRDIDPDPTH